MKTILFDVECFWNFFYIGFKRAEDGARIGVEYSARQPDYDRAKVRSIFRRNGTVGFNSLSYDLPMIWYSLQDDTTFEMLKIASDRIIKGKIPWWEVEDVLGIEIPREVKNRHIDLIEPQPNAVASLKTLNGRMHGKQLQDLPYHESTILTLDQMDRVADYCLHTDLDATHTLLDTLKEPLDLRRALSEVHKQNFMSKSDAQIGEAIVRKRVEALTGKKAVRSKSQAGTSFKYQVQPWMKFETPALQDFLEDVRNADFLIGPDGKTIRPDSLKDRKVKIWNMEYSVGIGGLHSTEKGRAIKSDRDHVLIAGDVASQYPRIAMMLGIYPKSLGPKFLEAYEGILNDRLKAKARSKDIYAELPGVNDPDRIIALHKELLQCQVADKGQKIALNGVYGKFGSRYSIVYAPDLIVAITLTGQISLLMLIEQAMGLGIEVVSANTDGITFKCPREMYGGIDRDRLLPSVLKDLCDRWEKLTTFTLEFDEMEAVYNSSVNSYFAIMPDGSHVRKGPIGNPWNKDKSDFDQVRGQLMKNPQMTICSDAALYRIKHGRSVEDTIRSCRDITQFVTVIKSNKGATWRGEYLGKTARFYWSVDGEPIYDFEANDKTGTHKKVSKSDGARECMRLPDEFPYDIDYERYILEAETILKDIGFYGDYVEPIKMPRATLKNSKQYLSLMMGVH